MTGPVSRASAGLLVLALAVTPALAAAAAPASPVPQAVRYSVTSTDDLPWQPGSVDCAVTGLDCTLRAAVQQANQVEATTPGRHVHVALPAGTFHLEVPPSPEAADPAATGDLAITGVVVVEGAAAPHTRIDASAMGDRHFRVAAGGASLTVRRVTLTGGNTTGAGGAIHDDAGGWVHLEDAALTGNRSASPVDGGGAVSTFGGTIRLMRSTIGGNRADGGDDSAGGGILALGGQVEIVGSTLSGNRATGGGGGVAAAGATVAVTNSTLSGNTAHAGPGGGILLVDGGAVNLWHATLAWNSATRGNAIASYDGTATLAAAILANPGPGPGPGCDGAGFSSGGHNLGSDDSCGLTGTGDVVSGNILVGFLGDHGGPTATHRPARFSAAIDAAGPTCPPTDQRGVPRPQGGACDIGAVEFGYETITGTVVSAGNGRPVPGVQVTLRRADGPGLTAVSTTGRDGAYRFDDRPEGESSVIGATTTGHEQSEAEVVHGAGGVRTLDLVLPVQPGYGGVHRVGGRDRFATAAALSGATFEPRVSVAYIATGADYPDALTGGVAAARYRAPLLLVTRDRIPAATAAELARLEPSRIVVLGGGAAVSDEVAAALGAYARATPSPFFPRERVMRLAGSTRFGTAAAVSRALFPPGVEVEVAYVASGENFPDALAGTAAAAAGPNPLLLVTGTTIPPDTADELRRMAPRRIVVLGGTVAVGRGVEEALAAYTSGPVERIAGPDRVATASRLGEHVYPHATTAFVATSGTFADGLVGGAAAGMVPGPLLLVDRDRLPDRTASEVRRLRPVRIVVLGGPEAVSEGVHQQLVRLMEGWA